MSRLVLPVLAACLSAAPPAAQSKMTFPGKDWEVVQPEDEGLDPARLRAAVDVLKEKVGRDGVKELVIVRRGRVVWLGDDADKVHGVWSCTKSFTSTVLGLLIADGKCTLETKAADLYPRLKHEYLDVTLRHFTTMTSGYRAAGDAEAKGGYLHGPSGRPFEPADALFRPGEKYAYWDSAMNVFGLCLTAAAGEPLDAVLKRRVMDPIGADPAKWKWGDRGQFEFPGGSIKVNSGSGNAGGHVQISAREAARFGHLMLNGGKWRDKQLIPAEWVEQATRVQVPADRPDGFPKSDIPGSGVYGYNWWVNGTQPDGRRRWPDAPARTFVAVGHNNNRIWVVPEWQMVIVRFGLDQSDRRLTAAGENEFLKRVGEAVRDRAGGGGAKTEPAYPPSTVIQKIEWAPADTIVRRARDGDNWPVTWADDDAIYTTWGDGTGFPPKVERKLSLGFARVTGSPGDFTGVNVRSEAEQLGEGRKGMKGWGLLSVGGTLYLWLGHADRNGGAARLAWSRDHAKTWAFADWRFDEFGLVGFVNSGKDYAGARDDFVYAYSHDGPRADAPADRFVLMRVPKGKLAERSAWEFLEKVDGGRPVWTADVRRRGTVFTNPDGCLRSAMTYNPGLGRYLWWQQVPQPPGHKDRGDTRFVGGFGVYDAPEPWGPWTTAYFTPKWDVGPGEHGDFPAKWMIADGRTLHLVFSGDDAFSVRRATLTTAPQPAAAGKPRLVVLTDIGGDPDDQQSLIRLMLYANEFEIEGLIASAAGTPGELKQAVTKPELIREIVAAYGKARPNLLLHRPDYPPAETLAARVKSGNPNRGLKFVGEGNDTDGSRHITAVVDRDDTRPVNVAIWGGQTDLAQALWRVGNDRTPDELRRFLGRLRVYDIDDQDGLADWITTNFPDLFYVLAKSRPGRDKREGAYRGMYLGGDQSLTSRKWVDANVRTDRGPLGALYPTQTWTAPNPHACLKEGDTPSWFYFLPTGLGDPAHPEWGGWGGRFRKEKGGLYRDAEDAVGGVTEARAAVWRWRPAFQADFAARAAWCVAPPKGANHPPEPALNGDRTTAILELSSRPGGTVRLSAAGSSDPDGDQLTYRWFVYPEPGSYARDTPLADPTAEAVALTVPADAAGETIHVVLEVTDRGSPGLTRYRRAVLTVGR